MEDGGFERGDINADQAALTFASNAADPDAVDVRCRGKIDNPVCEGTERRKADPIGAKQDKICIFADRDRAAITVASRGIGTQPGRVTISLIGEAERNVTASSAI